MLLLFCAVKAAPLYYLLVTKARFPFLARVAPAPSPVEPQPRAAAPQKKSRETAAVAQRRVEREAHRLTDEAAARRYAATFLACSASVREKRCSPWLWLAKFRDSILAR